MCNPGGPSSHVPAGHHLSSSALTVSSSAMDLALDFLDFLTAPATEQEGAPRIRSLTALACSSFRSSNLCKIVALKLLPSGISAVLHWTTSHLLCIANTQIAPAVYSYKIIQTFINYTLHYYLIIITVGFRVRYDHFNKYDTYKEHKLDCRACKIFRMGRQFSVLIFPLTTSKYLR